MSAALGNTVISIIEASLAAGVGAMIAKDKPATQAGTMTALAFLILALTGALGADYIMRGKTGDKKLVAGLLFIFGLGSFFTYFGIRRAKNPKAKDISGSLAGLVFMIGSISAGMYSTGYNVQTVIISNMYVLLGGIIGYNGQQSTKDKAALGNQVLAGAALLLLLIFDVAGAKAAANGAATRNLNTTEANALAATRAQQSGQNLFTGEANNKK